MPAGPDKPRSGSRFERTRVQKSDLQVASPAKLFASEQGHHKEGHSHQEHEPRPAGELHAGEEGAELREIRARDAQHRRQPDSHADGDQREEQGHQIIGPTASEVEREPRVPEAFLGDPTSHDHRRDGGRESNWNLHQGVLRDNPSTSRVTKIVDQASPKARKRYANTPLVFIVIGRCAPYRGTERNGKSLR